jgi:uncharacterized protein (TIGR03437 family)
LDLREVAVRRCNRNKGLGEGFIEVMPKNRRLPIGLAWLIGAILARAQTPVVNAGGIVNTASYASGGIAPGSIVSIFGTNLAGQPATASSIPLPSALGNVSSVTFNGVQAPLYSVSSSQINAQVPWNVLAAGSTSPTVNVVVTTNAGSSAPQTVQVASTFPGIFSVSANGIGQAIATDNSDGAIAAASGSISGANTHPIQIGSYLIVWCTGLGAVDSVVANGANTGGAIVHTLAQPTVLIGGVAATFVYSVLSPQYAGEYQVAVQVAPGTPTGDAMPLQIQMNDVTTFSNVTIAVAGNSPGFEITSNSCTLTSIGCTEMNLSATDPYSATGAFAGYADATIRQDPLTGTLWMAYSWPHTISSGTAGVAGTQVLDTHLASSTDGGKTWIYKGALYTSQAVSNPVTGQTDYTAHEVMNLFPQVINGVTWWYGIHSTYNVPQSSGGGSGLEDYTKRWEIALAPGTATTGPMGLASATPQYLGQSINTYPQYFPVALNLSSLDPEVSGCTEFFEPALILSNNNLYLFLACTPANAADRFYAVFKTSDPQDNAANWKWTYVEEGSTKFAGPSDAVSVGSYLSPGATYITQMDIAPSKNLGILLAIMSATYDNSSGKVSLGCAAAELASIDPPKFVYNSQGQVQVDAFLTSPDSQPGGPGSCTYSPFSATGMILAHRQPSNAPQNGGFFSFLMQSLLFP